MPGNACQCSGDSGGAAPVFRAPGRYSGAPGRSATGACRRFASGPSFCAWHLSSSALLVCLMKLRRSESPWCCSVQQEKHQHFAVASSAANQVVLWHKKTSLEESLSEQLLQVLLRPAFSSFNFVRGTLGLCVPLCACCRPAVCSLCVALLTPT